MKAIIKKGIVLLLVITSVHAKAQSLKDLLYSGKLKNDNKTVVRKTDDLSTKIDTSTRKEPVVAEAPAATMVVKGDSIVMVAPASVAVATDGETTATRGNEPTAAAPAVPAKGNTRLWKEYSDSLTSSIAPEIFRDKKAKAETYFVSVDYEIGLDGTVTPYNVISTPGNALLQAKVKDFMEVNPLRLAPSLDSNGQPKKAKRKQNFTINRG